MQSQGRLEAGQSKHTMTPPKASTAAQLARWLRIQTMEILLRLGSSGLALKQGAQRHAGPAAVLADAGYRDCSCLHAPGTPESKSCILQAAAAPHQCGLTLRSSGAPTAKCQARSGGTRYIFASPGLAFSCRRPLSSNVRPHIRTARCRRRRIRFLVQTASYNSRVLANSRERRIQT